MTHDTDLTATALAAEPATVDDIIRIVDELAIASAPTPRSKVTRPALITLLRDELAPSLGSTGSGRGGGRGILIDATALALWEDITGRIESMHEDLEGDAPVTGSHEQILLAWSRNLVAADTARGLTDEYGLVQAGLGQDAITFAHRRVVRIRDLIHDHFNPPRIREVPGAECLSCGETTVALNVDGEWIPAPALVTIRRGNQPLTVHCRVCDEAWTRDELQALARLNWAQTRDTRILDLDTPLKDWELDCLLLDLRDATPSKSRGHTNDREETR